MVGRGLQRLLVVSGVVLAAAAVWAVYGALTAAPLVLDDQTAVLENPSIVHLWPLVDVVHGNRPLTPSPGQPTSARPFANLTFALNHAWGGTAPSGYRVVNMAIHVVAGLLLWFIVDATLVRSRAAWLDSPAALVVSFVVALIWLVHPLQAECVLYVTQRTESLMGMFLFATLACCLGYWSAPPAGRAAWLAAVGGCCVLGALAKEVMVVAPLLVAVYERTFVAPGGRIPRSSWPLYAVLALAPAILLVIYALGPPTPLAGFDVGIPARTWWLTQARACFVYARMAVWPAALAIHYQMPYLDGLAVAWPWVAALTVALAAVAFLVLRRTPLGFLGACVVATLAPTFVIPMFDEVMADRRMYVPLAAVAAAVVVGAARWRWRAGASERADAPRSLGHPAVACTAVGGLALAAVLAVVARQRAEVFRSTVGLWHDIVRHQPDNFTARYNLGTLLATAGRRDEAVPHFVHAVSLEPVSPRHRGLHARAAFNLALLRAQAGDAGEAIAHYRRAIELAPEFTAARYNLAVALADAGREEEALAAYRETVVAAPDCAAAHTNLAILLAARGEPLAAIGHFERAVDLAPALDTRANLAAMYRALGRHADALAMAEAGLREPRPEGAEGMVASLESIVAACRDRPPPAD
jgi:tetratricopeptide (TPR) repeat protein